MRKYPERFSDATNENLSCKNCPEKLCRHKKQLAHFMEKNRADLQAKGELLTEKLRQEIAARQKAANDAAKQTAANIKIALMKSPSVVKEEGNRLDEETPIENSGEPGQDFPMGSSVGYNSDEATLTEKGGNDEDRRAKL